MTQEYEHGRRLAERFAHRVVADFGRQGLRDGSRRRIAGLGVARACGRMPESQLPQGLRIV